MTRHRGAGARRAHDRAGRAAPDAGVSGLRLPDRRSHCLQEAPQRLRRRANLKPSAMRGNEALWGYVVAGELIVVSILNLMVTHGKGAPAHPNTSWR